MHIKEVKMFKQLYFKDGGAMGIITLLFLAIPTVLLVYGITMQLIFH